MHVCIEVTVLLEYIDTSVAGWYKVVLCRIQLVTELEPTINRLSG